MILFNLILESMTSTMGSQPTATPSFAVLQFRDVQLVEVLRSPGWIGDRWMGVLRWASKFLEILGGEGY